MSHDNFQPPEDPAHDDFVREQQAEAHWEKQLTEAYAEGRKDERVEAAGWVSIDERLPEVGQMVLLWVYAKDMAEDEDGNPIEKDVSGVHMGECRHDLFANCAYIDNFSTPFADQEAVTHWMHLPAAPKEQK